MSIVDEVADPGLPITMCASAPILPLTDLAPRQFTIKHITMSRKCLCRIHTGRP